MAMLSSVMMLLMMAPAILLSIEINQGPDFFVTISMLMVVAYPHSVAEHRLFLL